MTNPMNDLPEVKQARRGLNALRLEVPEAVANDLSALVESALAAVAVSGSPPPTVWKNAFERLTNSCVEHFGHLPGDYDAILQDAVDGGQNFDLMAALKGALAKHEPSGSGSPPSPTICQKCGFDPSRLHCPNCGAVVTVEREHFRTAPCLGSDGPVPHWSCD